ncbi:cholinesterase [Lophiostoma macrostomum CBS 122681]|uniref:Carboxylic ester hydrolase n=1 Tax=Lophiostoma macrostomum CBS 122681 TaxID=1314788 RepID=A0A6A6TUM9_9PLEO|nr:cholinesterase [Lophiostoma macrostomum CBS 122681]
MAPAVPFVLFTLICLVSCAIAVPSPQSIGSDLTILTHNDLYGPGSSRTAAAIVLGARQSYSQSSSSCASLQESLWNPGNSSQDLGFLRYLDHGKDAEQIGLYWAGGSSGCQAIDTRGELQTRPCDSLLPSLCSQSASLSSKASVDASAQWQTSVNTGNASIVGYRDKLSFRFLGLKYATVPQRFDYPRYAPPSGSNVSGLAYGPECLQAGCSAPSCSEDCLYLNIWTPYLPNRNSSSTKKAVMLWIYGGGFVGGAASDTTFDGGNMAARGDVVVVTVNYRVSTLGFLALENTTLKGNYGIADQIAALEWVQKHIADFGGDKERITVFGQSAGASSVRALLASPQTKGLFSGAIMQSNPAGAQYASTFSEYPTIAEATNLTRAILNGTGCNQVESAAKVACLRTQDPFSLQSYQARYVVVDGFYLTSNGLPLNASAPKSDVSVMIGVMRDDGGPFSAFSKSTNASQALTEQGFDAADILGSKEFPIPQGSNKTLDVFNLTARVATDALFRCLDQSTAAVGSANTIFPVVYSYEFDRSYQISEWSPNPPTCEAPKTSERPYGDTRLPYFRCHSGDLYYVFGTLIRQGRTPRDVDDIPFSQYIVDTWTAFGRERNPNPKLDFLASRGFSNTSAKVENSEPWQPVKGNSPTLRILDTHVKNENFRESAQCDVLHFPIHYYSS